MNFSSKYTRFLRLPTFLCCFLISGCAAKNLIFLVAIDGVNTNENISFSLNNSECLEVESESQHFYESSGFHLPSNAQIILSCDDHGGFHNDGEYYLVFDTTPEAISTYLNSPAWSTTWQNGIIPQEIGSRTALSRWNPGVFSSLEVSYIVENRNTILPFHNGRLMIIDLSNSRVYYSQWDY